MQNMVFIMPKLNKYILTSVIEDIKEYVTIANELCSHVAETEYQSWKYPNKSAKDVQPLEFIEHYEGTAGEMYILLLELAYDRLNFILQLALEYVCTHPVLRNYFKRLPEENEKRLKYTSAAIMRLLWSNWKTMPNSALQDFTKSISNEKSKDIDERDSEIMLSDNDKQKENEIFKIVNQNPVTDETEHLRSIINFEDDPLEDMTRKLKSNEEQISILQRQNERLMKTIHRIKQYRESK